jgi:uncharacterized protein (TIGR01777 family)
MKILVTGGTGMVGTGLCRQLAKLGHELVILTRNPERARSKVSFDAQFVKWDALTDEWIDSKYTTGLLCVVNLAGEPLVEGRWTAEKKKRIEDSRGPATQKLIHHLKSDGVQLQSFVSASAMGFYGDRGDEILSEDSAKGEGFLSDVCDSWEQPVKDLASEVAERYVIFRISLVLGKAAGFLGEVLPIFRKGLGGNLASGLQWMSWIHEQDLVSMLVESISNSSYQGVINASAPEACQNFEMTKVLSKALGMPAIFPVPSFALKLVFGDKAEMLLASQRLSAKKLADLNFNYKHPDLLQSLKGLV